jgi:hypothetical protein
MATLALNDNAAMAANAVLDKRAVRARADVTRFSMA